MTKPSTTTASPPVDGAPDATSRWDATQREIKLNYVAVREDGGVDVVIDGAIVARTPQPNRKE